MRSFVLMAITVSLMAADFRAPAGTRPAVRRPGADTVMPGGRVLTPLGRQLATGPGPFGIAMNASASLLVTSDGGPDRYSLTVFRKDARKRWRGTHHIAPPKKWGEPEPEGEWRSVFMGLAFGSDRELFASEGNSGRVRVIDPVTGVLKRSFDLNAGEYHDSYTSDLAFDAARGLLWVVDQANFRVAAIDVQQGSVVSSVRVGRLPFALALSPDGKKAYVTNLGMFEYKPLPGADPKRARETGLPFPAFGFPSPEAEKGARRETAAGPVDVPGLGDPNGPESNSLAILDLNDPASPRVETYVRTGVPFGRDSSGGSSPSGVVVTPDYVFVSNAHNDSITAVDRETGRVRTSIPIRIAGLEQLRGVLPLGLAYYAPKNWLLVAEAGLNAVGVIDIAKMAVIGHLPVGWFPARIVTAGSEVFVTNSKGHGTGPNAERNAAGDSFQGVFRRGTVSAFTMPGEDDIAEQTRRVFANNGLKPGPDASPLPGAIKYVVVIVKENRTFDEVFGGIGSVSNGAVNGLPPLARYGRRGRIEDATKGLRQRPPEGPVNVTPNHHAIAERWAFSDNFYADSEVSVDGHHWIVGSYPNAWTTTSLMSSYGGHKDFRMPTTAPGRLSFPQSNSSVHPEEQLEAGAIWHHLERHGIPFRNFGEGFELAGVDEGQGLKPTGARYLTNVPMPDPLFRNTSREYPQYNMNIPDQFRAAQFIAECERKYIKGGEPFPRFIFIHLPNDHTAKPRPEDGYPFTASYVADNDFALGRMLEFLSGTPWWREMAVFITEDDAQGGVDHVDSHRTVLLVASPYAKRNYLSRVNTSFPGMLKTALRLLGLPPLNLYDAIASDLADCFQPEPDFTPFKALPPDLRIFDPAMAREPLDPKPSPRMDDPRVLHEQHRRQ
ncbi:MAG TPA: hypothetical protein VN428_08115 [Bryobacteraceae bacterium]|nr:hypothetical protein [Bryobacteraceae bacterium]